MPSRGTLDEKQRSALREWMDRNRLGSGELTEMRRLTGGTQNMLVRFRRGDSEFVLRSSPHATLARGRDTLRREAHILQGLARTHVPHPRIFAFCDDDSVIGSPYYLMAPIDGENLFDSGIPQALRGPATQRLLGFAIVDTLLDLSAVDYVAIGLGDLRRSGDWHGRQVDRWRFQLNGYLDESTYPEIALPGHDRIAEWLSHRQPAEKRLGLIHGDFHVANLLVSSNEPRVLAIIDWELCTIGDPLLDFAHLLTTWPGVGPAALRVEGVSAFPSVSETIEYYLARTGRSASDLRWFWALAAYRFAVLLEGTHARSLAGRADPTVGARLHQRSIALCELAVRVIEEGVHE